MNFYKVKKSTFLLLFTFSLTSCLDIVEEISFNKQGGGNFQFTVNLGQSKVQLKSAMLLDSIKGHKVPDKAEIIEHLEQLKIKLSKTSGISHVTTIHDFDNFIFKIKFDFVNTNALNEAINSTFSDIKLLDKKKAENYQKYTFQSDKFERIIQWQQIDNWERLEEAKSLKQASYTAIYRFEKLIQSYTNKEAKLAKNQKALLLQANIWDLLKQSKNLNNTLYLN